MEKYEPGQIAFKGFYEVYGVYSKSNWDELSQRLKNLWANAEQEVLKTLAPEIKKIHEIRITISDSSGIQVENKPGEAVVTRVDKTINYLCPNCMPGDCERGQDWTTCRYRLRQDYTPNNNDPSSCVHANEVPFRCLCPKDCYCKSNTCKHRCANCGHDETSHVSHLEKPPYCAISYCNCNEFISNSR